MEIENIENLGIDNIKFKEIKMLTDQQIDNAKNEMVYVMEADHKNNDSIRIVYEWLDAQIVTKIPKTQAYNLKHWIREWAGFYISNSDVEVATFLHPDICGKFPHYNISKRYTDPSIKRLNEIPNAFKHDYRGSHRPEAYKYYEEAGVRLLVSGLNKIRRAK